MKFDKKEWAYFALIIVFTAAVFFAAGAYCADLFEISRFKSTVVEYVPNTAPSTSTTALQTQSSALVTETSPVSTTTTSLSALSTSISTTTKNNVTSKSTISSKSTASSAIITSPSTTLKTSSTKVKESVSATESVPTTTMGKVNLNTATKEELMTIKGIGEVYATRIIEYRELIGYFTCLEELLEVKGIGEKRLAQWAPYLTV